MESYDRDIARHEAFMSAVKTHGLDYLKRAWDFEVCPKEIAKKALEHAGYDFNKIWVLNARLGHNPHTDRDEVSLTWLTVAYYLEQKGLITLRNVTEAKEKVESYCEMI